jgi:hypothetical protein
MRRGATSQRGTEEGDTVILRGSCCFEPGPERFSGAEGLVGVRALLQMSFGGCYGRCSRGYGCARRMYNAEEERGMVRCMNA